MPTRAWWADWLEPRGAMPSDDILEEIEEFHANLVAALDWTTDDPRLGLRLLGGVAVAWEDLGRAGDAMAAADRLLTDDNAQRYSAEWLVAAWRTSALYFSARGPAEVMRFLERIEAVAAQRGDEFYRRLARWPKESCVTDAAWRDLARQQADRHLQAWVPIWLAWVLAEDDPAAAAPVVAEADAVAAASGMRSLRDFASYARAELACSTGDLVTAIELTRDLLQGPWSAWWSDAIRCLSFAALLAEDEDALRVRGGRRRASLAYLTRPFTVGRARSAPARLAARSPERRECPPGPSGADVLDALAQRPRVDRRRGRRCRRRSRRASGREPNLILGPSSPRSRVQRPATRTAGTTLSPSPSTRACGSSPSTPSKAWPPRPPGPRAGPSAYGSSPLRSVSATRPATAGVSASNNEPSTPLERPPSNALGDDAEPAAAEGRNLDWRAAAAYARRARGERKRPHHGWASLTPTEQQVVALVSEGLTNPQIAERLLMGRATVKTHLEHIFTKLGIRSRAQLAAEAARRTSS